MHDNLSYKNILFESPFMENLLSLLNNDNYFSLELMMDEKNMGRFKRLFLQLISRKTALFWVGVAGIVIIIGLFSIASKAWVYTSSDKYCMSCHVHPHAEQSWRLGAHFNNRTGIVVHCADCHLPPHGQGFFAAKSKHGLIDLYGYLFKDSSQYHWDSKRTFEKADRFVYQESCLACHQNLFPVTLSSKGDDAHLYFLTNTQNLRCINCHLDVGHYDKNFKHEHNLNFAENDDKISEVFMEATRVTQFENYTEKIPGTGISFDMMAVPGGIFKMGSPKKEPFRHKDEGPVHPVKVSDFWMGKIEVSWEEYLAFFKATASQGRMEGQLVKSGNADAVTGPTPPWGAPDQGWGKDSRPAITMTWYAATIYCEWLSKETGKKYRLPTEAEWEYASRGGTAHPYFFEGDPRKYSSHSLLRKIIGPDTSRINSFIIYKENSLFKTQEPSTVKANPFGLKNMLGNVAEFCSDYYSANEYTREPGKLLINPKGVKNGTEHVIRGGSFKSDAKDTRCAARNFTRTKAWLVTDPQMPKSIWWYSDCIDVGFRVVCEKDQNLDKQ
jgi:formylglycine-generating enzyme